MAKEKSKNKFEMKYSFADSDSKLIADLKNVQEKILLDIAYKHYKKTQKPESLSRCR